MKIKLTRKTSKMGSAFYIPNKRKHVAFIRHINCEKVYIDAIDLQDITEIAKAHKVKFVIKN